MSHGSTSLWGSTPCHLSLAPFVEPPLRCMRHQAYLPLGWYMLSKDLSPPVLSSTSCSAGDIMTPITLAYYLVKGFQNDRGKQQNPGGLSPLLALLLLIKIPLNEYSMDSFCIIF